MVADRRLRNRFGPTLSGSICSTGPIEPCLKARPGVLIRIDIPERRIDLLVERRVLDAWRKRMAADGNRAWKPSGRNRKFSRTLEACMLLTTSTARSAVFSLDRMGGCPPRSRQSAAALLSFFPG